MDATLWLGVVKPPRSGQGKRSDHSQTFFRKAKRRNDRHGDFKMVENDAFDAKGVMGK